MTIHEALKVIESSTNNSDPQGYLHITLRLYRASGHCNIKQNEKADELVEWAGIHPLCHFNRA